MDGWMGGVCVTVFAFLQPCINASFYMPPVQSVVCWLYTAYRCMYFYFHRARGYLNAKSQACIQYSADPGLMHAQRHEGNKYIQSCALRDLYFLLYFLSHEGFFSASRINIPFFVL